MPLYVKDPGGASAAAHELVDIFAKLGTVRNSYRL